MTNDGVTGGERLRTRRELVPGTGNRGEPGSRTPIPGVRVPSASRGSRALAARMLAAGLMTLAMAWLSAGPAQAQTVTLVTNLGESANHEDDGAATGGNNQRAAQKFTVGTASHYRLSKVEVDVVSGIKDKVRVAIHRGDGTNPGEELYALTGPSNTTTTRQAFTAPSGAFLGKGESYFVVFTAVGTSGGIRRISTTDSNDEGSASLAGWSIDNEFRDYRSSFWSDENRVIRMKLTGNERASVPAMGAPVIVGPPQVNETLIADISGIRDYDGTSKAMIELDGYAYTYQWIRVDGMNEVEISGATGDTYIPVAADIGHTLKVQVSFTDDADNDEGPLTSDAVPSQGYSSASIVAAKTACPSDADWCGEMTVKKFNFDGSDNFGFRSGSSGSLQPNRITYSSESFRVWRLFLGRASSIRTARLQLDLNKSWPEGSQINLNGYMPTLAPADDPGELSVFFPPINWVVDQKVTVSVKFGNFPAKGKPAIAGSPEVGQTLTATTGDISDPDGLGSPGYSYRWIRVDSIVVSNPVEVGTDSTYTLVDADEGKKIKVEVSFTDDRGNAEDPLASDAFPSAFTIVAAGGNIPPTFPSASYTRSLDETVGAATAQSAAKLGDPITATANDSDSISYSLEGTNASKFDVDSSGQLWTKDGLRYDYEAASSYALTLKADDGNEGTAVAAVVINITNNEDEPPLAPDAPAVTATPGSPTSLEVRWDAPDNTGRPPILDYDVQYQKSTDTAWTNGPQNVSGTNASIAGLVEDTAYRVRVRGRNLDGDGPWSSSGEGRTARPGDVSVSFDAPQYTAREGGDAARVTVRLTEARSQAFTIPLTATRLGGAAAADYSGVPANVVFAVGETVKTFDVTATNDSEDDDGESVRLGFGTLPSGVIEGAPETTTIELADDDAPRVVRFNRERHAVREGVSSARVAVRLDRAPESTLTIPLTSTPLDGATRADYAGVPASVTFDAGETIASFDVTATVDADDDDGESVRLEFGTLPADVVAGVPETATIILTDSNALARLTVRFDAESYYVREGIGKAQVTAVLNQPPGRELDISLVTTPGGGATAADYDGVPATLSFGPSDTRSTAAVSATRDEVNDDGEHLKFEFGTLPAEVTAARPSAAVLYLVDEQGGERLVSFSSSKFATVEGNRVRVSLQLSRAARSPVTIPLTTTHRHGASTDDYSGVPASVTFAAGETAKSISIGLISDGLDDDGESIEVGLGALPAGYAPGKHPRVVIELLDADGRRTWEVWFEQSTYTAVEGGDAAEVTVGLSTPWKPWLNEPLVLPIAAERRGGATAADHSELPARVTILAGATTASFRVWALDDAEDDDGESIVLGFATPLPDEVRFRDGPSRATVRLEDDDETPEVSVSFDASVYTATEGGDDAEVIVRLDRQPGREVEIPLEVTRKGGAGSADYSGVPESVTFSSVQTWRAVTVTATDDSTDDDNEGLEIALGPLPARVSAGSRSRTVVNLADNDGEQVRRKVYFGGSGGTSRVREGGSFFVDMYLDPPVEGSLSMPLTVTHLGGATAADYEGMPDTVTFANSEKSSGFSVRVLENREQDQGKGLRVEFGALPAGVRAGVNGRGLSRTLWFIDNDNPPGISVADASVREWSNPRSYLGFEVRLDRHVEDQVRVDYQTEDGTAVAPGDYKPVSGTVVFERYERMKKVWVLVRDDDHDEGTETMTLRLSNAVGGRITDGVAEGRIRNTDPMPRAMLARFGRAAAVQVVEHVEERLEARREPGIRGRIAGRELRRGMAGDLGRRALNGFLSRLGGMAGAPPGGGSHGPGLGGSMAGAGSMRMAGLGGVGTMGLAGGPGMESAGFIGGPPGMESTGSMDEFDGVGLLASTFVSGDVLAGSAFTWSRETGSGGGVLSVWSRGAQSRFAGRAGRVGLNGDVRTAMAGADYARGPLVAGLSLARSWGLGDYRGAARGGRVRSAVTGLYPWLGYRLTERLAVWGVTGYGAGGMRLTTGSEAPLEAGLTMSMAAAGTRGELIAGGAGGFGLAFKADALWVGTSSDAVEGPTGNLAATLSTVSRFRTGLEGSREYALAGRMRLKPSVEVGLRHDGGDAEEGAGLDVGGGLTVSDASTGLAVDMRMRMLVVHQADGFQERGMSVSFSYAPTPSTPLGFTARVAPSWGGQATSGAEALWARETMGHLGGGLDAGGSRLDAELGYGLPVGRRFVGTPRFGVETSAEGRRYRVGYALGALDSRHLRFELGVEAQRREHLMQDITDTAGLARATIQW